VMIVDLTKSSRIKMLTILQNLLRNQWGGSELNSGVQPPEEVEAEVV
jgi:hypothetical protein